NLRKTRAPKLKSGRQLVSAVHPHAVDELLSRIATFAKPEYLGVGSARTRHFRQSNLMEFRSPGYAGQIPPVLSAKIERGIVELKESRACLSVHREDAIVLVPDILLRRLCTHPRAVGIVWVLLKPILRDYKGISGMVRCDTTER